MARMTSAALATKRKRILNRLAIAGAVPVLGVALFVSYGHIYHVTLQAGESQMTAAIMALSIDGLALVASVAIISGRRSIMPYAAFACAMVASLGANMLSADPNPISYAVAGWPTVSLLWASEILLRLMVPAPAKRKPTARKVSSSNGHAGHKPGKLVPMTNR